MFKKYLTLCLAVLVLNLNFSATIFAQMQTGDRFIINVKNTVAKVGTEPNRKIKVTLKDGTKLKGYITEITDEHFGVMDKNVGKVVTVQYAQVAEAKRDGLSRLSVVLISTAVIFGGLVALGVIGATVDDR